MASKHQNLGRPSGSWVVDPNNILTVLILNSKTTWPTKVLMLLFIYLFIYFIFQDYFEIEHKTC